MVLLLSVFACSTGQVELLPGAGPSHPSPKVYGGDAPDAPEHDAVIGMHEVTKRGVYTQPYCSGTLITDTVVLTAAHCLTGTKGARITVTKASDVAVYVGDDPSVDLATSLYAVTEVSVHPSYNPNTLRNDIALMRLSVPASVTPVGALQSSEGFTSSDVGSTVNFAGFGYDETRGYGVKLQADSTLGGLGCSVSGCPDSGDASTQVSYAQGSGVGPCNGDSGGPMFVYRTSGTYVGGITSYGDANCTVYGVSTRVDAYQSWIDAFVGTPEETGLETGLETGDPGGTCGDGVCDVGESCDGRSGTTACSDCDGVTGGKKSNRYCYVDGVCEGGGCP